MDEKMSEATQRSFVTDLTKAALAVRYTRPPQDVRQKTQQAIAAVVRRYGRMDSVSAAEASSARRVLIERCSELDEQVVAARKDAELAAAKAAEAQQVARDLWRRMPGEAKVAWFESEEPWIPDWLRPGASSDGVELGRQ